MVSSSDSRHVDYVGAWSAEKLDRLRRYLQPYMLIMSRQGSWCRGVHYIDAFAGSGRPQLRDADDERFINGSPRVALGLEKPFSTYTFIEQSGWRRQELSKLEAEYPDATIRILPGDCNSQLANLVIPRIVSGGPIRGFVFLDPFGTNLEWSTIEAIARTRKLEVLINFPTSGLVRAFHHNRPNSLTNDTISRMNRVWGSEAWREPLYDMRTNLLGLTEKIKRGRIGAKKLSELFVNQRLRAVFDHVSEPLLMMNSSGSPLYTLIHAGHNETGAKIAASVFGKPAAGSSRHRSRSATEGFQALPLLSFPAE